MEEYKVRLLSEFRELDGRRKKLKDFIGSNQRFSQLDVKLQYVMKKQLEFMTGYCECLHERISCEIGWDDIERHKGLDDLNTVEGNIVADKSCRVEIDAVLQKVKALGPSRERSLAITKLQEGIMWLGMDLKRLGGANPYPNSMNTGNAVVEPTADGMKM